MKTRLDVIHSNMIQRCTNPKHPFYARYGGRGISSMPRMEKPQGVQGMGVTERLF